MKLMMQLDNDTFAIHDTPKGLEAGCISSGKRYLVHTMLPEYQAQIKEALDGQKNNER